MSMNLVNLNVNPCKMCMPMGSVSAFCGIKGCMTLLHGSQGCSTYIRRHMATHYNEPVDIASSSLTEEGTVFGGEKNLIKGLENLISLYHPEVIGVATTCLAETIGEDIPRIIRDFHISHPEYNVKIIPVSSSGYSGTQYEGFFAALKSILKHTEMDGEKHDKINIITGMLSPADTRYLKQLLNELEIDYILLPDLSENLDGIYQDTYDRLPGGGTALADIAKMAGSRLSIELSTLVSEEYSPARYLYERYGVPYLRCSMPVGLRDTDSFITILKGGLEDLPDKIQKERGRYLDAMVDSHKYNAEGKAVIFGEPDFVYSVARLCLENGIIPVVTATGAKCDSLEGLLSEQIRQVSDRFFLKDFIISDSCDFDHIEEYTVKFKANFMIGSSDGRRIEEKLGIPLIRSAFPIHDHVGGQRVRTLGYEGSVTLLDRITNAMLAEKERGFRGELYQKYFAENGREKAGADNTGNGNTLTSNRADIPKEYEGLIAEKTKTHPCFSGCAGQYARIHLPVAKKCNIQCNYCLRKYDCPNESRPGVTTKVLTPEEALEKYFAVKAEMPNLKVVGIAGPGDSLAEFENTKKTLSMIRQEDPEVTFCLSTNGLMLPLCVHELAALGVSHVTITINAVDPKIGSKIYAKVNYMGVTYTGETAAGILLGNQLTGLKMLQDQGIICKVNIVMLKGINDMHIPEVVKKVKELGCAISNIMQMIPVKGSAFEHMPLTSYLEITEMRQKCGLLLPQMYHCKQCRADAAGTLENDESYRFDKDYLSDSALESASESTTSVTASESISPEKPLLFAVASKGGILVDQHFGHVSDFYIYAYKSGATKFVERRSVLKYCNGPAECGGNSEANKEGLIGQIFETIQDCSCVIAMRIGEAPRKKLTEKGIHSMMYYGRIEDAVAEAAAAV
ncbi:nitrogenase cofactor biosynthesis protein NifB [Sinanaerobacter chloroacetimidivorans]|uniref:Nitrogenase cofactor biosynthesis protein NifB n=1 Tax=Sinanaerobacter chloroacetimidivorans TaxID=2818044 RepID=A0A8J8B106_9FIRM|nr:nitrogenase cofactor biosynthesis protein NifB [Sinanaerobacter chloroacetimidivorans]MBR0597729.1 nitrogenase cofactor biosynthesis protein NifB [Sinanaerobacter chloroacetimidivorans]